MVDKFLRWATYKLLFIRLANTPNCCGALYEDETGKQELKFEVMMTNH